METWSVDRVREALDYNHLTGVFKWKDDPKKPVKNNARYSGTVAGCLAPSGYVLIGLDGRLNRAHRLAWAFVHGRWPSNKIDHINGIRNDNRIVNLREATYSQNAANQFRSIKNTSGFKGVSWRRRSKPWVAHIKINHQSRYIGSFYTAEEAHEAYAQEARRLFGEFARMA